MIPKGSQTDLDRTDLILMLRFENLIILISFYFSIGSNTSEKKKDGSEAGSSSEDKDKKPDEKDNLVSMGELVIKTF